MNIIREKRKITSILLSLVMVMSMMMPLIVNGNKVFAGTHTPYRTSEGTKVSTASGKFQTTTGTYRYSFGNAYAMCVSASKSSPSGHSGTIVQLTPNNFGNYCTNTNAVNVGGRQITAYQFLVAAAIYAQESPWGETSQAWASFHDIASRIVSGEAYMGYSGSDTKLAADRTVANLIAQYTAAGRLNRESIYLFIPDDASYQKLILTSNPPVDAPPTVQADFHTSYELYKMTDDGRPAVGAVFELVDGNQSIMGDFADLGTGRYVFRDDAWGVVDDSQGTVVLERWYREVSPPTHAINPDGSLSPISVPSFDGSLHKIRLTFDVAANTLVYYQVLGDNSEWGNPNGVAYSNWTATWREHPIPLRFEHRGGENEGWCINDIEIPVSTSFRINKTTEDGSTPASGATFRLLDSNMNVIGDIPETTTRGVYKSPEVSLGNYTPSSTAYASGVFYYEETSPATSYYNAATSSWINRNFYLDTNLYRFDVVYHHDDDTLHYSISVANRTTGQSTSFIVRDAVIENMSGNSTTASSSVSNSRYGSVTIRKVDANGNNLSGAIFTCFDSNGTRIGVLSETSTGIHTLSNLPYGSYYLMETTSPNGYQENTTRYPFTVSSTNIDFTFSDAVENYPLGTVSVHKVNYEGNNLSGATFAVYSDINRTNLVGTMSSDANGNASLGGLAYGTYYLAETVAPEGYEVDPNNYSFTISQSSYDITIDNTSWNVVSSLGMNGDFVNKNPVVHTTLTSAPTNNLTVPVGSNITLVDTVSYDSLVVGREYVMEGSLYLMDADGNPELDGNGNPVALTDANGNPVVSRTAFTPSEASGTVDVTFTVSTEQLRGKTVYCFEDCYYSDRLVGFHHGTEDQTVYVPNIHTTLIADETSTHQAPQNSNITLTDTVTYENLSNGTYRMEGTLMDIETGRPILDANGNTITSYTDFVINNSTNIGTSGTVDVEFTFSSELLGDKTIVAFETLYTRNVAVDTLVETVTHNDLTDSNQTVYVPDVHTNFYDRDLGLDVDNTSYGTNVTLSDEVTVSNLVAGEYTVFGTVMVKETNEPLKDANGNVITASATFTITDADLVDGVATKVITVSFTGIDTTVLGGKTLVCFETLESNNVTLAVHADLEDENQTVTVPDMGTTLVEETSETKTVTYGEECTLVDTIAYEGLTVGQTYTVEGQLYDAETGEAILDANGNPVVSESVTFVPALPDGTVATIFVFDTTILSSATVTIVAFEDIYHTNTNIKVATHADLTDESQQVFVPKIGTTADVNGAKTFAPDSSVTLNDVIAYTGLTPNREYRVVTALYNSDGTPFTVDGTPVTAEATFTPEAANGSYTATFTFNASSLSNGQQIVVFEYIYDNGTDLLVGKHEDLTDSNQTVTTSTVTTRTSNGAPSTGEKAMYRTVKGVCLITIGICLAILYKDKRNAANEDGNV